MDPAFQQTSCRDKYSSTVLRFVPKQQCRRSIRWPRTRHVTHFPVVSSCVQESQLAVLDLVARVMAAHGLHHRHSPHSTAAASVYGSLDSLYLGAYSKCNYQRGSRQYWAGQSVIKVDALRRITTNHTPTFDSVSANAFFQKRQKWISGLCLYQPIICVFIKHGCYPERI